MVHNPNTLINFLVKSFRDMLNQLPEMRSSCKSLGWIAGVSLSKDGGDAYLVELTALELGASTCLVAGPLRNYLFFGLFGGGPYVLFPGGCVQLLGEECHASCVREMLLWGWDVQIEYVPRERNNVGDCLAKLASREGSARRVWHPL